MKVTNENYVVYIALVHPFLLFYNSLQINLLKNNLH